MLAQLSDHRESSGDEQEHRKKYVAGLEHKRLISTESTKVELCDGRKRNGNLRYSAKCMSRCQRNDGEKDTSDDAFCVILGASFTLLLLLTLII